MGMRPFPAHAVRVNDAKQIQQLSETTPLSFEEAAEAYFAYMVANGPKGSES